ncbi:glycine zipper family protein [Vibrio sp. SS-MA-C1-2]|uniref:glycine zipper family protein n=1 Tax=Vibrio sp. SS-MA-C1-2 TaxID=2908646 RepID=UPI001F25B591|nr:glycine zipper family protein [Vibrio sp. SS-MA-C1-2]UJF17997.1 glycine zipper family protein [Vibrio sp. SS-MA-C1-2]
MKKSTLIIATTCFLGSLLTVNLASATNLIIDTQGLDQTQYSADMYQCQQLSYQVQPQMAVAPVGGAAVGAARGAAVGAAGVAIAGGSGSEGAKIGAGIGLVRGIIGSRQSRAVSQVSYSHEVDQVMRNCMINRGYKVLN